MQSLIRSKSAGVTGGRGTAGAGPGRDLHYEMLKGSCSMARRYFPVEDPGHMLADGVFLVWGSSSGRASPC